MQSQNRHDRCTERARLNTTRSFPASRCMYGACVSRRARSVLLLFSPQVLSVAHLRITLPPSIHSFSVVRGRGKQQPSRSGGTLYDYATCNVSSLPNFELWSVVWTILNSVPCFLVFPRSRLERQFVTFLLCWSRHVSLMISAESHVLISLT